MSPKPKTGVTAADLMKELQRDSQYLARTHEQTMRRDALREQHRRMAQEVIDELQESGYCVDSLDVLRRSGTRYETAVPILLKWLPKINDLRVKEAIVRALSVPWARPLAAEPLISEFRKANESTNSGFKWAIANALEVVADESVLEEIIELVQDKHHGKSREMLAAALGNMESPRAIETLIALLGDEEVAGHALSGLRKLKAQQARAYIQRFLTHKKAWIRSQAKRALAALDKV